MTEEMIKQNAEAYANKSRQYYLEVGCYEWICDAHEAGAHSRDEEIKELNGQVTLHKERADYYHDLYMKLRNPWIKPSEQMPVDGDDIVYLLYEGKAGRMKYHSTYEKWLRESATHWMKVNLKEE